MYSIFVFILFILVRQYYNTNMVTNMPTNMDMDMDMDMDMISLFTEKIHIIYFINHNFII